MFTFKKIPILSLCSEVFKFYKNFSWKSHFYVYAQKVGLTVKRLISFVFTNFEIKMKLLN